MAAGFCTACLRGHPFFVIVGSAPLGLPLVIWVFVLLTVALAVLYRFTRFGFVVRAIGSNRRAAEMSGIPIGRVRTGRSCWSAASAASPV